MHAKEYPSAQDLRPAAPSNGADIAQRARRLAALAARAAVWLLIGASLSGLMTWLNLGWVDGFFWRWLTGFVSALTLLALGFVLIGRYDKLVQRHLQHAPRLLRTLVLAALMALTMECFMSLVVTWRNLGWGGGFAAAWLSTFWRSLPAGLAIGLLMGFVVRPWLQRRANPLQAA